MDGSFVKCRPSPRATLVSLKHMASVANRSCQPFSPVSTSSAPAKKKNKYLCSRCYKNPWFRNRAIYSAVQQTGNMSRQSLVPFMQPWQRAAPTACAVSPGSPVGQRHCSDPGSGACLSGNCCLHPGCLAFHFLVDNQNPVPTYPSLVCVLINRLNQLLKLILTDNAQVLIFVLLFELFSFCGS